MLSSPISLFPGFSSRTLARPPEQRPAYRAAPLWPRRAPRAAASLRLLGRSGRPEHRAMFSHPDESDWCPMIPAEAREGDGGQRGRTRGASWLSSFSPRPHVPEFSNPGTWGLGVPLPLVLVLFLSSRGLQPTGTNEASSSVSYAQLCCSANECQRFFFFSGGC